MEKLLRQIKRGHALTLQEIEDMYIVRSHFLELKSAEVKERDFISFSETVKRANEVFLFKTASGTIKGSYVVTEVIETSHTARKRVIVEPDCAYIHKDYQGQYLRKTTFRNMMQVLIKFPFHDKYLVSAVYPAGFLTLKKHGHKVWTWFDEGMPDDIRDVLFRYGQRHSLLENGLFRGIKTSHCRPKDSGKQIRQLHATPAYSLYKTMNPNWEDGCGVVCLVKLDRNTLWHVLKNNLKIRTAKHKR